MDEGVTGRPGGLEMWRGVDRSGAWKEKEAGWAGALVAHLCLPPGPSWAGEKIKVWGQLTPGWVLAPLGGR